jgi:hypothetical protein
MGVRAAALSRRFTFCWHRVVSDEVWHLYEGSPLELRVADAQFAQIKVMRLDRVSAMSAPNDGRAGGALAEAARPLAIAY